MSRCLEIFMVNYNTSLFTNMALTTVHKNLKRFDYHITVFDNSSKSRFQLDHSLHAQLGEKIAVVDNTRQSIIDFDKALSDPEVQPEPYGSKHGSFRHAMTIDFWLYNMCNSQDVLLLDSDILLKRDIDFIDESSAVVSDICPLWKPVGLLAAYRFYPFIQYLNAGKLKEMGIHYFDPYRILNGKKANQQNQRLYDTGGSLFEDVVESKIAFKRIVYEDYIFHFGGGSWNASQQKSLQWMQRFKQVMA